jgi:hypothetical protein
MKCGDAPPKTLTGEKLSWTGFSDTVKQSASKLVTSRDSLGGQRERYIRTGEISPC